MQMPVPSSAQNLSTNQNSVNTYKYSFKIQYQSYQALQAKQLSGALEE